MSFDGGSEGPYKCTFRRSLKIEEAYGVTN